MNRGAPNLSFDRELIRDRYLELLARDGSDLLADAQVAAQLVRQLDSIVDAVALYLGLTGAEPGDPARISTEIGTARAVAGIHPARSLGAASMIFEAVLSVTVGATHCNEGVIHDLAVVLNRTIMGQMSVAAESYIRFLLDKMHSSNRDERRRISRELHDIAAPPIAMALQNLELHDAYATDCAQAAAKLDAARHAMMEAMATVRTLAAATRESVSRNGLEHSIGRLLARNPIGVKTRLDVGENLSDLPATHGEEVFLILNEAIRNAFTHARASNVIVGVVVRHSEVIASVRDDGLGFDVSTIQVERSGQGIGLVSMHERAALLGGILTIDSVRSAGTSVTIRAPLPPSTASAISSLDGRLR